METQTNNNPAAEKSDENYDFRASERRGRVFLGLIIMAIGGIFFAKQTGIELPDWLLSWPMILIVVGLFIGVRHRFRDWAWLILILIGSAFLAGRFIEGFAFAHLMWPIIIIAVGLLIIIRPKNTGWEEWRGKRRDEWKRMRDERRSITPEQSTSQSTASTTSIPSNASRSGENYFENVNVFGGSKKVVISKDFRGGEVVTIFGGSDINFTQADINGIATLDMVQIFGGAKLIIPSNWRVQTEELVCIFGGLDDKRHPQTLTPDDGKVLILKGVCIFGGIDLRSY
jgi:predicted membrane protein